MKSLPHMARSVWIAGLCCSLAVWLASCGSAPLTVYTLGAPAEPSDAAPLGRQPVIVAVSRVTLPDELDTEDMVVREGSVLKRSQHGRWATRLSLGITDRLTERLAKRRPDALVTDRPMTETPAYRVQVNIARLDVTPAGVAILDADWLVLSRDSAAPPRQHRGHFTATGPVATDQDVATLIGQVLDRLAAAIDLPGR